MKEKTIRPEDTVSVLDKAEKLERDLLTPIRDFLWTVISLTETGSVLLDADGAASALETLLNRAYDESKAALELAQEITEALQ